MNHYYDTDRAATRCGEYEGETAFHVSANDRVSCPDCLDTLTPDERAGQWYDRLDNDEATDTRNHTTRDQLARWFCERDDDCGEAAGWAASCDHGFGYEKADVLLASDAIAAVRAAAVAETTATIEAVLDPWGDPMDPTHLHPQATSLIVQVRAALSGGRTALDTMLAQAWDDGWNAAVDAGERCDVAGGDFTCGECAICTPTNPYRADTGADQ